MRRTAGVVFGLSVVGCHGLHPTHYQTLEVVPLSCCQPAVSQAAPPPLPPTTPQMLPTPSATTQTPMAPGALPPSIPQAGPTSYPHPGGVLPNLPQSPMPTQPPAPAFPVQQLPQTQAEPPLAPGHASAMSTMDPNLIAQIYIRRLAEDTEAKRLQMELTREMVAQIMQLRQKVAELSKDPASRLDVGLAKQVPTTVEAEKHRPAPQGEASAAKSAPAPLPATVQPVAGVSSTPADAPATSQPTPATPPQQSQGTSTSPTADDLAARQLQMELTRELGRQVIDLKQKVQELRGEIENWAEAGRQKREEALQKEVQGLRAQIAQLQAEMAKLRAPQPAREAPNRTAEPVRSKSKSMPDLLVPPPEESRSTPSERSRWHPRSDESVQVEDPNRRFAEALKEIRASLEDLKATFVDKLVRIDPLDPPQHED